MPSSPLSRRQFLSRSLKVGAGAAALGWTGNAAEAWAATSIPGSLAAPPAPPLSQRFVTRPDIVPPGVTISATPGLASQPGQPSYIFLAPRVTPNVGQPDNTQGFMMIDLAGDLVWWRQSTALAGDPFNFRVQTYQGKPALTWYQGEVSSTGAFGLHGTGVISDNTYTSIAGVKAHNYGTDLHEFLLTPQDTAFVTAYAINSSGLVIGHVQEIDISSGDLNWYWSSSGVPTSDSYSPTADYFHVNSVDVWPTGDVLISARNTWSVYLVSKATKETIWTVGGKSSSFDMGTGTRFEWQHDARALADGSGISLFDDASQPGPEHQSWGKVISLDQSSRQATLRHEYNHSNPSIDAGFTGNCQLIPSGGHFIGWGSSPYFSLYGPSGSAINAPLLLDGRLPAGIETYRAYMYDWTGNPEEYELRLVVHHGLRTGHWYGYASWNGATEVAAYALSAGTSTSSLDTVETVRRQGFETTIPFTASSGSTDFQVAALDSRGAVLGRSVIVHAVQ